MDYSKFSDDTLTAIASGKPLDYSKLSDDELGEIAGAGQPKSQGLLSRIDSYTGAPVRAGVGALEQGKGLMGALSAAKNQFGGDSAKAPTGTELFQGLPDVVQRGLLHAAHVPPALKQAVTPAAGFVAEVATNPVSYVPVGEGVSAVAKGLEKAAPVAEAVSDAVGSLARRNIVVKPILTALENSKSALSPEADAEAIDHIDGMISRIKDINKGGKVNAAGLKQVNQVLSDAITGTEAHPQARIAAGMALGKVPEIADSAAGKGGLGKLVAKVGMRAALSKLGIPWWFTSAITDVPAEKVAAGASKVASLAGQGFGAATQAAQSAPVVQGAGPALSGLLRKNQ